VDREEYLRKISPTTFPAVEGCSHPPGEWIADAWDSEVIQRTLAWDFAKDVSQDGTIGYDTSYLARLSVLLRTEQVVRLYLTIREESPHREAEFRSQFVEVFSEHASALPPPLMRTEVLTALVSKGFDTSVAVQLAGEE
jgi:hypothetical protein